MRILYLAHRVPYAPDRGDRIRAYHTLRFLTSEGHRVHLLALAHDDDEERHAAELASVCASWDVVRVPRVRNLLAAFPALLTSRPLTHALLDAPGLPALLSRVRDTFGPELVFAFCSGVAAWLRTPALADLPFILDLVDVDSAKWREYAASSRPPMRWIYGREARLLARFERATANAARATLVVNEREASAARTLAPAARVVAIGNGVDGAHFAPPVGIVRRRDVVFTAVFDYRPNEEGALWLAREVWPAVQRAHPDARLLLVGARPTSRVRALAPAVPSIVVTGTVPDVREYLWHARVAAAPLFIARGTQNKVLEAVAAGLPAVVTSAVFEGLPDEVRHACRRADDARAFSTHLVESLDARATAPSPYVPPPALAESLAWPSRLAPLRELLANEAGVLTPAFHSRHE